MKARSLSLVFVEVDRALSAAAAPFSSDSFVGCPGHSGWKYVIAAPQWSIAQSACAASASSNVRRAET